MVSSERAADARSWLFRILRGKGWENFGTMTRKIKATIEAIEEFVLFHHGESELHIYSNRCTTSVLIAYYLTP